MSLAFESPDHPLRNDKGSDMSTSILAKLGQASHQSLSSNLTATWLAELDLSIRDTKSRISERIKTDVPAFDRQLESSKTVRTRLNDLSSKVNGLDETLNGADAGILPVLLRTLSSHREIADKASDSDFTYQVLAYLFRTQKELEALSTSVKAGDLTESAQACGRLHTLITEGPSFLNRAEIMDEIRKRYRTLHDRVQEQLTDAFTQCIIFSSEDGVVSLDVHASTNVPPTSAVIVLPGILRSLTSETLSARLSSLRRDIISKFVEPVLRFSQSLQTSTHGDRKTISLTSSLPSFSPLRSLETLYSFLKLNIFPHLPLTHSMFPNTLHIPMTTAILTYLLKPSIPSSISLLSSFINIVDEAVRFEQTLLPLDARERIIQHWADDVADHFEKKRREDIMQHARQVIERPEDGTAIKVEVAFPLSQDYPLGGPLEGQENIEPGWGFDDEIPDDSDIGESRTGPNIFTSPSPQNNAEPMNNDTEGGDTYDAWGWDDTEGDAEDEVSGLVSKGPPQESILQPEEDPWGDDGWDTPPPVINPPVSESAQFVAQSAPKLARRLEKLAAKSKNPGVANVPDATQNVTAMAKPASPPSRPSLLPSQIKKVPSTDTKPTGKEMYLVSSRAKTMFEIAEGLLKEGQDLMHSNILSRRQSSGGLPGQLLIAAGPMALDLYRALYPVVQSSALIDDQDLAMRLSNDYKFLRDRVTRLCDNGHVAYASEKWTEAARRLKVMGDIWYENAVTRQQDVVRNTLVDTENFSDVANAEQFEKCKGAFENVLREITSVGHQWKVTLTRNTYLQAVGQLVNDTLLRIMDDILSLADIPEADSERLSELCEMLTPLEELFVYSPGDQSVVGSYVTLWFKFSYLPWLLKGSIADLSYLFDQGMLIDYEVDELVRLLQALFAETPLRENTIAKISKGHSNAGQRGED